MSFKMPFLAAGTMSILIFVLVFGIIIFVLIQAVRQWNANNHSPELTVNATVITKRVDVRYHHHHDSDFHDHTSSASRYYVTFQIDSGDRIQFMIDRNEYGLLIEGDKGKLTFQGTRYLGFDREF